MAADRVITHAMHRGLIRFLAGSLLGPVTTVTMGMLGGGAVAGTIHVSAALSLREPLSAVNAAYEARTRERVSAVYGPSLRLARDMESGAVTDVFISADQASIDFLAQRQLVRADTLVRLIKNQLAVVAKAGTLERRLARDARLRDFASLALADPSMTPSGRYGQLALENLGLWDVLRARIVVVPGGRSALEAVDNGRATGAIVYVTEAKRDPRIVVQTILPQESYPEIVYSIATTANGQGWPAVSSYVGFVRSEVAYDIFEKFGFQR